jgi:cell division protein FtsB
MYIDTDDIQHLVMEVEHLRSENKFLKERNKDLRQKTWIGVYDENLKLQKQVQKFLDLKDQYYQEMIQLSAGYHKLEEENKHLQDVIKSVEAFIGQYSK